jgi:hypothetical protein
MTTLVYKKLYISEGCVYVCLHGLYVYLSLFIPAVLALLADKFITFQDPRNIFLRRHSVRVSSYQILCLFSHVFCPTHLIVLQQETDCSAYFSLCFVGKDENFFYNRRRTS